MTPLPTVALIGPGVVGTSLGLLLQSIGHPVRALIGRRLEAAQVAARLFDPSPRASTELDAAAGADWILITTPDRVIESVCRSAAQKGVLDSRPLVAHCSGALDAIGALASARDAGCAVASCHPLLSFADVSRAVSHFAGTFCFLEGDPVAVGALGRSLGMLKARPVALRPGSKALYHAAAAIASNNLVAGTGLAVELLGSAGLESGEALESLVPLLQSTLDNLASVGLPDALTGPIERGDAEIVAAHLRALQELAPHRVGAYTTLAELALELAVRKGSLDRVAAESLRRLLESSRGAS